MSRSTIETALSHIFKGIGILQKEFAHRRFTIDGRLVGDIGEIIAAAEFNIVLHEVSRPLHDADTTDGRGVQIKATFQNHLTFRRTPDLYLGIKLSRSGGHDVIYNGPGHYIFEEYKRRQGIGERLLRFPISRLKIISAKIPDTERVPGRVLTR